MKVLQKQIRDLSHDDYYLKHLQIINQFFKDPMSNKELLVVAKFMSLTGDLETNRFSTTGRKIVMESLSLSPGGLGNYLNSLYKKGFIFKNNFEVFELQSFLLPEKNSQGYQFKITKNVKNWASINVRTSNGNDG